MALKRPAWDQAYNAQKIRQNRLLSPAHHCETETVHQEP